MVTNFWEDAKCRLFFRFYSGKNPLCTGCVAIGAIFFPSPTEPSHYCIFTHKRFTAKNLLPHGNKNLLPNTTKIRVCICTVFSPKSNHFTTWRLTILKCLNGIFHIIRLFRLIIARCLLIHT